MTSASARRAVNHSQPDLFGRVPDERRRAARPFDVEVAVRAIWYSGVDPRGTLTEKYLAGLGLPLPDEDCGRVIRHHNSLAFAKNQRLPGMLTLLRDLRDDRPVAVVRTFLDQNAHKLTQRILGPAYRAAAKLTVDEHGCSVLHVTVGIEEGLRAAADHRPIWTFGNAEALASLPTVAGVRALTIITDDADERAVAAVSRRWTVAGRDVIVKPP